MTREKGYDNRSLALAEIIRTHLVEHRQKFGDEEIAGTITLLYDQHKQLVQTALTNIQHDHHEVIISIYAEGEALLGWLNCTVQLAATQAFEADPFLSLWPRFHPALGRHPN